MEKFQEGLGGDNNIKVNILLCSNEYQQYLSALRQREILREENGGDTIKGINLVRKTVTEVDNLAKKNYQRERSN